MHYKHKPTIIEAIEVQKRNLMDIEDFVGENVVVVYEKDRQGNVYVGLTKQSILNYCNRSDLPEALNYTLCQICADTYRDTTAKASGAVVSGAVSSISEDGRTVSFSNSLDLIKTAAEDRIAHTTELNRYKKLYRLD